MQAKELANKLVIPVSPEDGAIPAQQQRGKAATRPPTDFEATVYGAFVDCLDALASWVDISTDPVRYPRYTL